MSRRRRLFASASKEPILLPEMVKLWILRILVPMGKHSYFVRKDDFEDDPIACSLGLGAWVDRALQEQFDRAAVFKELVGMHREAEGKLATTPIPPALRSNIQRLCKLVNLTEVDCRILEFAVMLKNESSLESACGWLGDLNRSKLYRALAGILGLDETEVRQALRAEGRLAQCGLLQMRGRYGNTSMDNALELLSDDFAGRVLADEMTPLDLLRKTVRACAPAELQMQDFAHVQCDLDLLLPYLAQASEKKQKGVNIFIYGSPGTGKTQLVRTLACTLGLPLYEVSSEDEDGDPITGDDRLNAYRAAQSFLANTTSLLVFDEVEDVIPAKGGGMFDRMFGEQDSTERKKAWMNRALEENPVPTVWLSNSSSMDAAFLRRFDMVFELPIPGSKQRLEFADKHCADIVSAPVQKRIAQHEDISPAMLTRAGKVVRALQAAQSPVQTEQAFEHLLTRQLMVRDAKPLAKAQAADALPDFYHPDYLHTDQAVAEIAQGLQRDPRARICLYGPPGTGKTAWARWLAEQLGKPLHIKRVSDLQSMWVGQAEKNMARAFAEAEREGAVLLIDEVDSFLQDRRGAKQSWEVSQVNEMLTQMEAFDGLFIASTNVMRALDQAVLRRFDLKVRFDFLKPEQSQALLQKYCEALALGVPANSDLQRVVQLRNLAPGDFACVARKSRFAALSSANDLLRALQQEYELKEGSKSAIGFV